MVNKQLMCSTPLVIREKQIKTTLWHYSTITRIAIISSVSEDMKQLELPYFD